METAKAQQVVPEGGQTPQQATTFWLKAGFPRLRGLQVMLILPYVFLTLAIASFGIFIVTRLVAASVHERFHNSMIESSRVANDGIVQHEKVQLDKLRFLIFQDGMAQAIYDKKADQIEERMRPIFSNAQVDVMTAVDSTRQEIISFGKDYSTGVFHLQEGVSFSGVSSVEKVLQGTSDEQGDKFVEVLALEQGPVLFTSGPVVDSNNQIVGAMMVGTYLDHILVNLKQQALADIVMLDSNGDLIATTLSGNEDGFDALINLASGLTSEEKTKAMEVRLNGRPYQVAYSPLTIRTQPIGWLGVVKNSEYIVDTITTSRDLLVLVFSIGTLGTIVLGYLLAQNIARPITRMRVLSQSIAAGDLNQSIGIKRDDEIGELADAFDTMTVHLRERTDEAARLYEESLQRNKELAEINERLKAMQMQLIQSEKLAAIGQLTAGIVHDVKNPFAVIMGMAEVMSDDEKLDETTRHGLKVIRESAVKGNTIVSDLLKFARQQKPEMRYMNLTDTLQTAMRLTAYLTRRFKLVTELPEEPLMVTYDSQQIEQVLINLIHNAIQAMPNGGKLSIGLQAVGDSACITIQDSGCGIPQENLQRIFDPFFTTKPEGEGTGLGLSVSYGIIANHGGRIEVDSKIGEGTTFRITLPINQPQTAAGEGNG